MKKNNKAIKKKASIFRMYGKYFLLFIVFVGILGALNDMIKNPAHRLFYKSIIYGFSYICFGIVVLMVVTYVIYEYFNLVLSFYRQTKLPLKKEEMKKLNITNPDEYLRFVDNYLPRIKPNKDIQYRVIFIYTMEIQVKKKKRFYKMHSSSVKFLYVLIIMNTSMISAIKLLYVMTSILMNLQQNFLVMKITIVYFMKILRTKEKNKMSDPKSKSVNIYDGLCNFIESFHYIQTVDLYDGDDELIYSAKELREFIISFGVDFLSMNTLRKIEYDEDIYHVKLYAVEKIGHDIMNYFNKIAS